MGNGIAENIARDSLSLAKQARFLYNRPEGDEYVKEQEIRRPVYDMLRQAAGRTGLHMPGHKGCAPFGAVDAYGLDTTELPLTDDLYCPEHGLLTAQRLYAAAAGAAETIFLHNGSTSGNHVMTQLWAREGDTVLLPRNAHLSAVNGCIMGGVRVRWMPVSQTEDGYCYVAAETVLAAMDAHPEAKAVLLTRPDYYGGCIPLEEIIRKAHGMGMRVAVDEAHGAHLPWSDDIASAGALGADAWVQSVHKTIPGMTACAVLHLRDGGDRSRALQLLRREQTSSPSFILMMAIDDARAWMDAYGRERLSRATESVANTRTALQNTPYGDAHEGWRNTGYTFDPSRLVVTAPQGGFALARALAERGIDVEMADDRRVVAIITAMDNEDSLHALTQALEAIPVRQGACASPLELPPLPKRIMEVRQAVMADCEAVPLCEVSGRVSAAVAGLYPPGVPLVCPGEMITDEMIDQLTNAAMRERFGVEGDCLLCVR